MPVSLWVLTYRFPTLSLEIPPWVPPKVLSAGNAPQSGTMSYVHSPLPVRSWLFPACFSSAAAIAEAGEPENMPNVITPAALQNPRLLMGKERLGFSWFIAFLLASSPLASVQILH